MFLSVKVLYVSNLSTNQSINQFCAAECREFGLDAVILFDGSQSIITRDFVTMIDFIKNIIRMFTAPRAQVGVWAFSVPISVHSVTQNY